MSHYATVIIIISTMLTTCRSNIGSALFNQHDDSVCWNPREVAKLRVRSLFESLAPSQVTPDEVDKKYLGNTIKYLKTALKIVETNDESDGFFKEVLADTFGAHLKCEILPSVRTAYYAGYVPYIDVKKLHDILDDLKAILNTQSLGWCEPKASVWSNLTVSKIVIGNGGFFDPCADLITIRDHNSCIRFPSPKLDDEDEPTAIALPFKRGGLVGLLSPNSENIILKFYSTAANCILNGSPVVCRDKDLTHFHKEMWYWMKRNVGAHLSDETLYTAYGGILRVAATVQSSGLDGLMRQSIFRKPIEKMRKTWKLMQGNDSKWMLYVVIVLMAVTGLCLLQCCYNYMFGDANVCEHFKINKSGESIALNDNTKTRFPHIKRSKSNKTKVSYMNSRCINLSEVAVPTQKVFDMNADKERIMAIVMSDQNDTSDDESDEISEVDSLTLEPRPPKIETRTSQLEIKTPYSVKSKSVFSTSSGRSENYRERKEDSIFSESGTSDLSMASDSVNNHGLCSIPRISKQNGLEKSFSTVDANSYLTPLSRRNF